MKKKKVWLTEPSDEKKKRRQKESPRETKKDELSLTSLKKKRIHLLGFFFVYFADFWIGKVLEERNLLQTEAYFCSSQFLFFQHLLWSLRKVHPKKINTRRETNKLHKIAEQFWNLLLFRKFEFVFWKKRKHMLQNIVWHWLTLKKFKWKKCHPQLNSHFFMFQCSILSILTAMFKGKKCFFGLAQ